MPLAAVNVLNSNNFLLEDLYDGVLYTFAPGTALTIPVEAAKHIFGWDERAPGSISFLQCRAALGLEHQRGGTASE
jgi:hypothetical protein